MGKMKLHSYKTVTLSCLLFIKYSSTIFTWNIYLLSSSIYILIRIYSTKFSSAFKFLRLIIDANLRGSFKLFLSINSFSCK
jgi:hypothetical protein